MMHTMKRILKDGVMKKRKRRKMIYKTERKRRKRTMRI